MSNNGDEAEDLAKLGGGLVINMGTVTPESLRNYQKAIHAYNAANRVVVFDPVGYVFTFSPIYMPRNTTTTNQTLELGRPQSGARLSKPSSRPVPSP